MATGIMSIGVTGMQAAQLGLMTTQHNIANASTVGYSRQRTVQATNNPLSTGSGFVGQGVHVSTIERMYSNVLNTQVVHSQASVSQLDTYYSEISQIDNMLTDSSSGVSSALSSFFTGIQGVAAAPKSLDARQAMVSAAQSLAARFNTLSTSLTEMADGVNSQITSNVTSINSYAQQIAVLNERIIVAQSSTNQPANDLLDQRDALVGELNKLVGVTTMTQNNGSYTVTFGNGQQLVVGTSVTTLAAVASSADPSRTVVGIKNGNTTQELPESLITGGALGGLISFRKDALDPAMNELGRVAASVAQTYNAQSALGQDLLGNIEGSTAFQPDLFVINPSTAKVIANTHNTGTAELTTTIDAASSNGTNFYTNLTASDYRVAYDGANYTVTRLSDNYVWPNATDPAVLVPGTDFQLTTTTTQGGTTVVSTEGITINLTAGMASGDSFLIQPTRDMAANLKVNAVVANDPRLITAAAPVATATGTTNTGTASITAGSVSTGYTAPVAGSPITLTYASASTELNITGLADPTVIEYTDAAGLPATITATGGSATIPYVMGKAITLNNVSFSMNGTPADGDTFTVSANTNGVADSRNAVLLGKLQTQSTVSGATATYAESYAQLISDIGNKARSADVTLTAQQSLLDQATAARDALSGVNLDEEAANLLSYQQAYQASAKMLQIGSELFDTLLSIGA